MRGGQGKHDRQEAAIKRTEATILAYEEKLKSDKKQIVLQIVYYCLIRVKNTVQLLQQMPRPDSILT